MQKRKSPLEAEKTQKTTLNKRVNPLELKQETVIETKQIVKPSKEVREVVKTLIDVPVLFKVEKTTTLKRKFVITRLSKDIFEAIKSVYPEEKANIVIDNAILNYLYSVDKKKYDVVVSKLKGKDAK